MSRLLLDYLYVDAPKLTSIHGQITFAGGSTRPTSSDLGWSAAQPQPSQLMALESELGAQGFLLDLTLDSLPRSLRDPNLRKQLGSTFCIKVAGRAVFEDFQRIRRGLDTLADLAAFVNRSVESGVRNTDDFKQLEMTISAIAEELKENTDRTSRAESQSRLQQMKGDLDDAVSAAATVQGVEPWVIEGLKTWIDGHLAGAIRLRLYPAIDSPDEQVLGNLKRENFQDASLDAVHFSRGSMPTERLTLVGVVTALPTAGPDPFNPMAEFDREELTNPQALDKAHRDALGRLDVLEQLARNCRFPKVMVQPLLLYRSVKPNLAAIPT